MVEGITCAPAVTGRVLPGAAASLTWGVASECGDVAGARTLVASLEQAKAMAFLLSLEGDLACAIRTPARKSCPRSAPVLVHGARPARYQVHSCGPWDVPSREWSVMPVSSWAPAASVRVVPARLSSTLDTHTPAKAGGVQMRRAGTA